MYNNRNGDGKQGGGARLIFMIRYNIVLAFGIKKRCFIQLNRPLNLAGHTKTPLKEKNIRRRRCKTPKS